MGRVLLDSGNVVVSMQHCRIQRKLADGHSIAGFRESYPIDEVLPNSEKIIQWTQYYRIN
jgi:hypothetical protein